jgi:hypothetical protein
LLPEPKVKRLLSHEHFSVDGTLLNAWASMTSLPRLAEIVHSLSHYCCFPLYPNAPGRGTQHAFLEREMIQHVVHSGWLVGKLKRPETPKAPKDWPAIRYVRVQKRIIVWTGKRSGPTGCCASCGDSKSITRDAQPSNQEPRLGTGRSFFLPERPHYNLERRSNGGRVNDARRSEMTRSDEQTARREKA